MVDLMHYLVNLLFFVVPFYLYIILLLIHQSFADFFWRYIYIYIYIYFLLVFPFHSHLSKVFRKYFFDILILAVVLLPHELPVTSAAF